jgi:hypothetical protein
MQHKILTVPQNMNEFEVQLNSLGTYGWEMVYFRNTIAYFMNHGTPLRYKITRNPTHMDDYRGVLDTLGLDDWIVVDIYNGYTILKKIAIQ